MTISTDVISFEVKDWVYPNLEPVAKDLALFIHRHKSLMGDLNSFMRISSTWWRNGKQTEMFNIWRNGYVPNPKRTTPDKIQLAEKLQIVKNVCETQEDWNKMRGLIPEKVFEIYFNHKHGSYTREYGAQVLIHGQRVSYKKPQNDGTTASRITVDAGSWDGTCGEFVEVKFQPEGFNETDLGYLNLLEEKLMHHDINHCIFLVSFDKDISYVKSRLEGKSLLPTDSKFKILGPEEFLTSL